MTNGFSFFILFLWFFYISMIGLLVAFLIYLLTRSVEHVLYIINFARPACFDRQYTFSQGSGNGSPSSTVSRKDVY